MLRYLKIPITRISCLRCTLSQLAQPADKPKLCATEVDNSLIHDIQVAGNREKSVLDPVSEDISHVSTYLKPSYNIAAYANRSEIIHGLVKLGVNFHYIEKKVTEAVPFVLKLNFDDVKEHILFLNHLGVDFKDVGNIITKNPFILKERLDDMEFRINYLKFKKFSDENIARIITKNPFWLSYSTQDIDKKLGFFQSNFMLNGNEVRQVAVGKPQLITFNQEKIKVNIFVIKDEMGFSMEDMKKIILNKPSIFMNGQYRLVNTFDYLHNVMKIPHEQILEAPEILTCRVKRLKERYEFLVKLKRCQFDKRKPNYIGLLTMIKDSDGLFATEVAKSSVDMYNMFLKTL